MQATRPLSLQRFQSIEAAIAEIFMACQCPAEHREPVVLAIAICKVLRRVRELHGDTLRVLASASEIETFIRENDAKLKTKE